MPHAPLPHSRYSRLIKRLGVGLVASLAALVIVTWSSVRSSLPQLDGERAIAGLDGEVTVERDALGVATITAGSRRDLAGATGFLHAQDRFFQMDLLRRLAAGELSELFGPAALGVDRSHRLHRFRATATARVDTLPPQDRELLRAYTQGVNAGLAALRVRPFEYLVLGVDPTPWHAADTLLVNYAMYFDLNDDDASRDATNAWLHETLPDALERFLLPDGTSWDAPLIGAAIEGPPPPGPATCDLSSTRRATLAAARTPILIDDAPLAGSNAWTVAAARSATGWPMVANDMHLPLRVPNIWYRMRWRIEPRAASEAALDITGVTLPGAPVVVAGSNGNVAWGFTNSYGDWSDLVLVDTDPANPTRYRTSDGWQPFESYDEPIRVRGGDAVVQRVETTIWGPVLDTDQHGRKRAVHWLAHEPGAANLRLLDLERATTVEAAIRIAHSVGAPPQNIMLADRSGNTAWTIMGRIPRRAGIDPRFPASWAEPGVGWVGWLDSSEYPRITNPPSGFLWTANARTVDSTAFEHIGRGTFALGARAQQIRDDLMSLERASLADMLAIQLDDRARLLQRWKDLLVDVLRRSDADPRSRRMELLAVLEAWDGRATAAAAGYRLARAFRQRVHETLLDAIVADCGSGDPPPRLSRLYQSEGPIWQLVSARPANFLPASFASWDAYFLDQADAAIASCGSGALAACSWGAVNEVDIRHPLAAALPFVARWLTVNDSPLPGGRYVPRVQDGIQGASERFAVSPGDEANGYFHMPGGQSGHPMSAFFRAGHDAWARGEPLPFLPGATVHRLTLRPAPR